jgi:phosphatidylglycerophosphatase A
MMISDGLLKQIATLGVIGYLPSAPGTFGSLAAFSFYLLLKPTTLTLFLIAVFLVPLGVMSSHRAEKLLGEKDSRHIVIDEFCGYFFSVLFLPYSVGYGLAAFFLFRGFDILKPFPIRRIENCLKGGAGIMADDIAAALYSNIILQLWKIFALKV